MVSGDGGIDEMNDDKPEVGGWKPECFIMMPISDPDGHEQGHFQHVYEELISPACDTAGYDPVRAP